MADPETINVCRSCGFSGTGQYCSHCGHPYKTNRISFSSLLHDVLHLFTHFEKGFFFTLKQLIIAPGHMQRTYIEGRRSEHQKPFSMFFICVTLAALGRYWILKALFQFYHAGEIPEINFFHEYMVVTYIALVPVYALIGYLLFYKTGYNYAEMGVWTLYSVSFLFLASTLIALLRFIWPYLDTVYIEFPLFSFYFTITLINFFNKLPRWQVVLKSLISISAAFFLNKIAENFVIQLIS